jgi:purine-binding chemotaxis protein CheW
MPDPAFTASSAGAHSVPHLHDSALLSRLRESIERLKSATEATTNADVLAQRIARRAELLRDRIKTTDDEDLLQFLGISCGRRHYGIPLSDVLEVQALEQYAAVPGAPPFLRGVTHWRGTILSLLDVDRLLGIPQSGLVDVHVCIVVEGGGRRIGMIASEIDDLYTVPRRLLPTPPSFPGDVPAEWIYGVHEHRRLIFNPAAMLGDPRIRDWRTAR